MPVVFLPSPGGSQTCPVFLDLGLHFKSHFIPLSLHLEDLGVYLLREAALAVELDGDKVRYTPWDGSVAS